MLNVVMTTCDRLPLLQQSLRTIFGVTRENLSLVLVDDSHDPKTVDWIMKYKSNVHFSYSRNPMPGCIGAAKNHGVGMIPLAERGDYLYISDSDTYYTYGWDVALTQVYRQYAGQCPLIGGWNHPYLQPMQRLGQHLIHGKLCELKSYDAIAGVSWLLSWDAWDKYGPFAANALGPRQSEDWEFCQRIRVDWKQVGAVSPWPVLHTGLTDSRGKRAPGSEIYAKEIPWGVLAE